MTGSGVDEKEVSPEKNGRLADLQAKLAKYKREADDLKL